MRSKNYKGRCIKRNLPKFSSVCKAFDEVQNACATKLSLDPDVKEVQCNVLIDDTSEGEFTTDFYVIKIDGTFELQAEGYKVCYSL